MTDPHATLLPVYYREPDTLIGVGDEAGTAAVPHRRGVPAGLRHRARHRRGLCAQPPRLRRRSPRATAGWAATRTWRRWSSASATRGPAGRCCSTAATRSRARRRRSGRAALDMVRAMNQLGVEVFTPHWEFTYGIERVRELFGDRERRGLFAGDFVCHNCKELNWDEPVFAAVHDPRGGRRRGRRDRPGVSVRARLAPPALRARPHLRHPGGPGPAAGRRAPRRAGRSTSWCC